MDRKTDEPRDLENGEEYEEVSSPGSNPLVLVVCLLLGIIIFGAVMAGMAWWFGRGPFANRQNDRPPIANVETPATRVEPDGEVSSVVVPSNETEQQVPIFFTADGLNLKAQVLKVTQPLGDPQARIRYAMQELLRGPASDFLMRTIPEPVVLRAAYLLGDTAVVDLSSDLINNPLGGPSAELLCIYSIVNTVTENAPEVRRVRILVEGQTVDTLWDSVDLLNPLASNAALIRP